MNDELKMQPSWRVTQAVTSNGFGARSGDPDSMEDLVGLTLYCEKLDEPGVFVFSPDEAEAVANAMLEAVQYARDAQEGRPEG